MKIVKLVCSTCGKDLNTNEILIQGQETIEVIAKFNEEETLLNLSAIWGNFENISRKEIPNSTIVELFCPHCKTIIPNFWKNCISCGSPIAMFKSIGKHDTFGSVMVCRRKGCHNHKTNVTIPTDTPASP
ncbi:MAG: hypothetical protein PHZ07_00290 [Patescibacteria group bacterium]|nr:hypothetical protein [Patescibacteria group bacterium]MDD4304165.1 hypothetical protein [Patescibacteria group bacterium]MDD4695196.1 hypothetical protein [Patescibacteria group bacterium]